MRSVTDRFLTYVKHYTTSAEDSSSFPSTERQLRFAEFLAKECKAIGLSEVTVDNYGYMTATLPANAQAPTVGFIAHMDTSPDAPGENVQPHIIENYDGGLICLNGITISPEEFPFMKDYVGDTLITSDGTTLLGADDKAGIAEILTAMDYFMHHPEIPHGKIRICFTPDEEIGCGVDHFRTKAFGADFAFTVDGGRLGELQYENFNAAGAQITITGKSVHTGDAKNTMINAITVGMELASLLPEKEVPEKTEGYEGFFHLHSFTGSVSEAKLSYLIRDFDTKAFESRKRMLQTIVQQKNIQYKGCIQLELKDQYYNMSSQIEPYPQIISLAKDAMEKCGVTPIVEPIRGGTDGARLSFMGLPCPNLFTGGHNFHGPYEFIPVSSMEKAVAVIVGISQGAVGLDFLKKV